MTNAQSTRIPRRCIGVLIAVVLISSLLGYWLLARPIDVDDWVVQHIQPGVDEAIALRMMGIPPGDYRTRRIRNLGSVASGPEPPPPRGIAKVWDFNSKCVIIYFADGKVEHIVRCDCEPVTPWLEIEEASRKVVEFCKGL